MSLVVFLRGRNNCQVETPNRLGQAEELHTIPNPVQTRNWEPATRNHTRLSKKSIYFYFSRINAYSCLPAGRLSLIYAEVMS